VQSDPVCEQQQRDNDREQKLPTHDDRQLQQLPPLPPTRELEVSVAAGVTATAGAMTANLHYQC
jgi:hypothetical protein